MDNKGTSGVPKPSPITTLDAQQAEAKCSSCKNHMLNRLKNDLVHHCRLILFMDNKGTSGVPKPSPITTLDAPTG
ncbi:hypothetical protein C5167_004633 [Papaver somniferum]|uniref:Uncharacterized protein n=1 Tax=Papaver somniferum TaxID=3469 RepID=A0A4Y7JCG1_PAPSO|nr:hypothetical protein C5167_004633 [Papaver somniferum]